MCVETLSRDQEISIANTLKELYFVSVIKGEFYDNSDLFHDIVSLVDKSIQTQNDVIINAGGDALWFSTTEELATSFWDKYQKSIIATEEFAYEINSRFGYTIDLANVIAPFFLYQVGVTDEVLSFYIGLGLAVANIICDSLASKKAARDEAIEQKKIKTICSELTMLLLLSRTHADEKEQETLDKSIKEIEKILMRNE